jgi:tetratricopeptide (TPR) repeat protein
VNVPGGASEDIAAGLGADDGAAVYRQVNQPEAGGVVYAVQHGDQFVYVHHGSAPYRVAVFGLAPVPPPQILVDQAPSWLLAARHEVVTFTGRNRELADLQAWRDTAGIGVSVRLIHGPGGQGKTRLAARFVQKSAAVGWTAATALHRNDPAALAAAASAGQEELRVSRRGLLLVVDYAERWPAGDLLAMIADHQATAGRVRVLLLARPGGAWWRDLAYRLARIGITEADHLPLTAIAARPQERVSLFTDAAAAFVQHLGVPGLARPPVPQDLERDRAYGLVLTVHMAALAAVDASRRGQSPPPAAGGLSEYLLDRERDHWAVLHEASRITTIPAVMSHVVYTATMTRALRHDDAVAALNRAGVASDPASATVALTDHAVCYPPADPATVLEPLYPDRLAEDFLALSTPGHGSKYPADAWAATAAVRLLAAASDGTVPRWTRAGLAILIETAARWPHIATDVLYPLLAADPPLALTAGGAALTRLADLPGLDLALLDAIEAHLPSGGHVDLDPAAAVITTRLHAYRLASAAGDDERAGLYAILGIRLANANRPEEALAADGEAAQILRRLAAARPDEFEPDLAEVLNNLGMTLSQLGRREEALGATGEAAEVFRRLAAAQPPAFEPGLASVLANLGVMLAGLGRREEALAVAAEAAEIYRRLAGPRPDTFEPDLTKVLSNLGLILSGLGRPEQALAATEEATEISRRLAAALPAAFEPGLATSLSNLGIILSGLERPEQALAATKEAAEIYRRLTAARPDVFEPDLARSLLGYALVRATAKADLGRALAAAEEGVTRYEALASRMPLAFTNNLAAAFTILAEVLDGLDRAADAAAARRRAEELGAM